LLASEGVADGVDEDDDDAAAATTVELRAVCISSVEG
jgi:hypothetical protein